MYQKKVRGVKKQSEYSKHILMQLLTWVFVNLATGKIFSSLTLQYNIENFTGESSIKI